MKRIGIITMHRVVNVGSVLQAYALCEKICQFGAKAEIIDYQYPNRLHSNTCCTTSFLQKIKILPGRLKYFILYRKTLQNKRFEDFFKRNLPLSKYYPSLHSLYNDPPKYDIYLTGSDQVWNPKYMLGDEAFLLGFIKNVPKASYAASFSTNIIPDSLKLTYTHRLKEYNLIGVREIAALDLVRELTSKSAFAVCDPTLLLKRDDYAMIAESSQLKIPNEPYILVYALSYAYNPYPQIDKITEYIKDKLGYKVIYLYANSVDHYHLGCSITSAGPSEFIALLLNAKFVVTSSFHGTAFAVNFEVPFMAVVPDIQSKDSRIGSFLTLLGLEGQMITITQDIPLDLPINIDFAQVRERLEQYRGQSEAFLQQIINL